jgi:glycopeptidolipid biosynthesis protein
VWTQCHSLAFDYSVWEIWGALLYGGRLLMVPDAVVRSPEDFHALLVTEQVSVLSQTPSAFYALQTADALQPELGQQLKLQTVVFGGEALEPQRLSTWMHNHPGLPRLINMYGITETTVHVTYRRLSPTDTTARTSPIGRPLPGVRVHVVDRHGTPTPPGGQGEMLVGGAGLARGYLGRPEQTAERFRPDDIDGHPGARLYASGDLATVLPDGQLGYLGRLDQQVKVRGYRIEPAEVEAALVGHPAVAAAAVTASDRDGRAALVAHLVPAGTTAPSVRELRRYLSERLPGYMVPNMYSLLDRLPLNRNGKLDYAALPEPDAPAGSEAEAPRTPTERALVALWRELLGVPSVGVHDDFFDLGGDSLLVTLLHARLPELFGVELPMRQVYQVLDVASLAEAVDRLCAEAEAAAPVVDTAQGRR